MGSYFVKLINNALEINKRFRPTSSQHLYLSVNLHIAISAKVLYYTGADISCLKEKIISDHSPASLNHRKSESCQLLPWGQRAGSVCNWNLRCGILDWKEDPHTPSSCHPEPPQGCFAGDQFHPCPSANLLSRTWKFFLGNIASRTIWTH